MPNDDVGTYLLPDVYVLHETDKAVLVRCADWEDDLWIPKSHVHDDSDVWKTGQKGDMLVTEWIAIQKGLIDG